jgi:hypothetical protein
MRLHLLAAGAHAALVTLWFARPPVTGPIATWTGDELASAVAWIVALALATWLASAALVCEVALLSGRVRCARAALRVAPPFMRRVLEVTIVGSSLVAVAAPAGATPAIDEPVVRAPRIPTVHPQTTTTTVAPSPTTTTTRPPAAPAPPPPSSPSPPRAVAVAPAAIRSPQQQHVVRPGENLWLIARQALIERGLPHPDDATIASFWRAVIVTNLASLRSGDPSLIYPGESVALPASA